MHAAEARGDVPRGTAARWQEETPKGKKLPERVKKSALELPDHLQLEDGPESGMGYQLCDLHLADGRILTSVPVLNGSVAVTDDDSIDPSDIEYLDKVGAAKVLKKADLVKYTRVGGDRGPTLRLIKRAAQKAGIRRAMEQRTQKKKGLRGEGPLEGGLGDTDSSSATQFPYGPDSNRL